MDIFVDYGFLFFVAMLVGVILIVNATNKFDLPAWIVCMLLFNMIAIILVVFFLYYHSIVDNTVRLDDQIFDEVVMEREICAASISQRLEGEGGFTHIVGTGGGNFIITSQDMYNYYYLVNGLKKRESVPVSEAYIDDTLDINEQTPKIVQYHHYRIETYRYKDEERQTDPLDESYYYIFYVPEGSVVETFDFN